MMKKRWDTKILEKLSELLHKDLWPVFRDSTCHNLARIGIKCDIHKPWAITVALLIILPLIVFSDDIASYGIKTAGKIAKSGQTATTLEAGTNSNDPSQDDLSQENCFQNEKEWSATLGALVNTTSTSRSLAIPQSEVRGLYVYPKKVHVTSSCTFRFVPLGEAAINYTISFADFYEVVIGDNDYRTVTLRATEALQGSFVAKTEVRRNSKRPFLDSPIKKGTKVLTEVIPKKFNNGDFDILVRVTYTADTNLLPSDFRIEEFSWRFRPSPILDEVDPSLSVGLIRAAKDDREVAALFLLPKIGEKVISPNLQ